MSISNMTLILADTPATEQIHKTTQAALQLSDTAEESSYFIARIMMNLVKWILDIFGLDHNSTLFFWLYVVVVFIFAWVIGSIIKWTVVLILRKMTPHVNSALYTELVKKHFFIKSSRIIPAILFLILIEFTLYMHTSTASWLTRLTLIYVVITISLSLCILADSIWYTINMRENKRKLPLKGLVQVIKLLIWIFATIAMAAILFDKSPARLLAGLGAFAAVLMLIFKDSILGIVAGVQLAENDSLHVGDWISVPNSQANGIVSEVSLTDVKIINWDKTISTVPPYTLISSGFKNFRNMQESNTRRIQRSYMIDADSVVEITPDMLEEFRKIPFMSDWIDTKIKQRNAGNEQNVNNEEGLADGTIDTNLGMFRAYVTMYLNNNKNIDKSSTLFVTTLAQTSVGIPLQIYCFTNTSSWIPYEGIQASVFEHLAVMMYRFHLYTYESASGRDTIIDGVLSAGKTPEHLFGMPYPTFDNSGTPPHPGVPPEGMYH
ncbi:MAG: mechanosensitive ion channel family protein [Candidatus Amulumruptor caecigallinarius]|nr:mechanosensitive ion channel family protein [Candidatus Amulumruptor caecigallinarius]